MLCIISVVHLWDFLCRYCKTTEVFKPDTLFPLHQNMCLFRHHFWSEYPESLLWVETATCGGGAKGGRHLLCFTQSQVATVLKFQDYHVQKC